MYPLRLLAVLALGLYCLSAGAEQTIRLAHLELQGDARYHPDRLYARYNGQASGRPFDGAEVALRESKFAARSQGLTLKLERYSLRDDSALLAKAQELIKGGVHLFLLDLPAASIEALTQATRASEVLLFNTSAPEVRLRQEACAPHLFHTFPSEVMASDALVQFLIANKWREVLLLKGNSRADQQRLTAFHRSAKRYGLKVVDERPFLLSNDPRHRAQGNVKLLSGKADYDFVYVIDSDGEFARGVPYQTQLPRPVIGSAGLSASAWHWSWERNGAPQLNARFEKRAKHRMGPADWAAWAAVKALVEAMVRGKATEVAQLRDYLLSEEMVVDGFKGTRSNFRPWNRQLRQPLLIHNANWVVERAPLRGFLHAKNSLDSLGIDQHESRCRP